jgi:hypothetical protein
MDYEGDEPGDARDVAARAVTLARLFQRGVATGWNTSVDGVHRQVVQLGF